MTDRHKLFDSYPDVVGVPELQKMLGGISKRLAYRLLSRNEIHHIRVGREYKIPKCAIVEYLMREDMQEIKIS